MRLCKAPTNAPTSWLFLLLAAAALAALGAGCGEDDGDEDAGPAECPTGAPDEGESCNPNVGSCTYEGLNRECPPLVGACDCTDEGWHCAVPECPVCDETCNGVCCEAHEVCRNDEGGIGQECGEEGNRSALLFEDCGHESDCEGSDPVCSPICGGLCCTIACGANDPCPAGTCENGVCSPPEEK